MFVDIISYRLALGTSREDMLHAAGSILETWMKKQEGFLRWDIGEAKNGEYIDLVFWKDESSAQKAEQNMKEIPGDHPWLHCYEMSSIQSQKIKQITSLLPS